MSAKANEFNIAVCQLTSTDSVEDNVLQMETLLSSILASKPDLVCFPENCLYLRVQGGEAPPRMKLSDPAIARLTRWSAEHAIPLHLGSVPLEENGHLFNASLLLHNGKADVVYKKIHLFDVDVEGAKPQRESDVFAPGRESSIFEIKGWKFGSSICYDVRFSELYNRYARSGVDVILVPAAFLVETGRSHWHILIRARAIESQAYVVAATQGGIHHGANGGSRATYGHALVIEPWGDVVAEIKDDSKPQVVTAVLRAERIKSVRRQIPMSSHRKL